MKFVKAFQAKFQLFNRMRLWESIAIAIVATQISFFSLYILSWAVSAENPLVIYDQMTYYEDAVTFFHNKADFYGSTRPIFAWLAVILLRLTGSSINYQLLSLLNLMFYQGILILGVYLIYKYLKSHFLTTLGALSTIWSMPLFFGRSASLMGDVAVGSWVVIFAAGLVALQNPYHRWLPSTMLGIIAGLGVLTKPIFFMYPITAIVCLGVIKLVEAIFFKRIQYSVILKKTILICIPFSISTFITGKLVFPEKLPLLVSDYLYNNEVLGYWQTQLGIFNTYLWFPTVVFSEIAIIPAFILSLVWLKPLIIIIKDLLSVKRFHDLIKVFKNYAVILAKYQFAFSVSAFLIIIVYLSLRVLTKEAGSTFFILPLFIICSFYLVDIFSKKSHLNLKIYVFLIISILISNLSNTLSWSSALDKATLRPVNQYLNLPSLSFTTQNPVILAGKRETYQRLGISEILTFLNQDCKELCVNKNNDQKFIPILVPHGAPYSFSVFQSASYANKDIIKGDYESTKTPFQFLATHLNYGGWGAEGGIPKGLFKAPFIILVKNFVHGDLVIGNSEIYNQTIAQQLSKENPIFMDGLESVFKTKNRIGDTIIVYKRKELPKADNFSRSVELLVEKDPNNLWNVPFIYAALKIHPQSTILQQQLAKMSDPNFIKQVKYEYGNPEQESLIQEILKGSQGLSENTTISYPNFLESWMK